jgi:adenine-specific DNA-methyltransferase
MNDGELKLIAIACALIGNSCTLTAGERRLSLKAGLVKKSTVSEYRDRIAQGDDILGTEFCELRSTEKRRKTGTTYTPPAIVKAMISWAESINPSPYRVIDPGIGSGRFISAAAKIFPAAQLIGVDIDPFALLMARANACVLGYSHRLHLELGDYRGVDLPVCDGKTLFIGNPPYVRHHDIADRWKTWFAATARRYGFKASKLAGLHIHFFLRTREIANRGDYGAFITSAEWLDVNYGSTLRRMLVDGLGGSAVHVIDPKAKPFADAFTTGAVTCFRVGERPTHFAVRAVHQLENLAPLDKGRAIGYCPN